MKEVKRNGLDDNISKTLDERKAEQGNNFFPERINLAGVERRTGVSRARLKRRKANSFIRSPMVLSVRNSRLPFSADIPPIWTSCPVRASEYSGV